MGQLERLRGKRSAQAAATPNRPSSLITNAARFAPNRPAPRSRARKAGASPQHPAGWQPPGHRSRGRAALPATPTPAPERRAAAAGRCTPRRSRGTLKDGRRRPEPCGVCSAHMGQLHLIRMPAKGSFLLIFLRLIFGFSSGGGPSLEAHQCPARGAAVSVNEAEALWKAAMVPAVLAHGYERQCTSKLCPIAWAMLPASMPR